MTVENAPTPDSIRSSELLRPWKLTTFAFATAALIVGAYWSWLPDWNVPISLIMAFATYVSASWVLRVFVERNWRMMPVALLTAWGTIYGCYVGYWQFTDPSVLNGMLILPLVDITGLYIMAGLFWLYRGSIREFVSMLNQAMTKD